MRFLQKKAKSARQTGQTFSVACKFTPRARGQPQTTGSRKNAANAFIRSARWVDSDIVSNAHNRLPPDWTTIVKLTRLDERVFKSLMADGTIHPELQRNEVSRLLRLERVRKDEQRVLGLVPVAGKFHTLIFDPAWEYDWLSLVGGPSPDMPCKASSNCVLLMLCSGPSRNAISRSGRPTIS
jgi:hypothetical protein